MMFITVLICCNCENLCYIWTLGTVIEHYFVRKIL
jgi:hypothetical protein